MIVQVQNKNMSNPVISIIIPFFDGGLFIENTITSILESTLSDIEVIIIDDGSPGETGKICDYLADKYEKVRTIHKKNGGIADARNRGVLEARGKYLAFVDQDDTIAPDMYRSLVDYAEQYGCEIIISNYYLKDDITGEAEISDYIEQNRLLQDEDIRKLRKWLIMGEVTGVPEVSVSSSIWNCIILTDFVRSNNICFESFIRYDDDYVFLLRCLAYSKSVYLCAEAYYRWRLHMSSESHTVKYLDNIADRYERQRRFKLEYLKSFCDVTAEELNSFTEYLVANTIYVTVCNEAVSDHELSVSRERIRNVISSCGLLNKKKSLQYSALKALIRTKGKRAGLIYKLTMSGMYLLAMVVCRMR